MYCNKDLFSKENNNYSRAKLIYKVMELKNGNNTYKMYTCIHVYMLCIHVKILIKYGTLDIDFLCIK